MKLWKNGFRVKITTDPGHVPDVKSNYEDGRGKSIVQEILLKN